MLVKVPGPEQEMIKCNLCGAMTKDTITATHGMWDWFCGYLPETFHVCSRCQFSKKEEVESMKLLSQEKPDGRNARTK